MHAKVIVAAIAAIPFAFAAPPRLPTRYVRRFLNETSNGTSPDGTPVVVPTCDLSKISQPQNGLGLAPPAANHTLVLIALGEGTQNYTCGTNLTAAPSPIGAVAKLFDASCTMANNPDAVNAAIGSIEETASIGTHFFVDNTTPDFDITGMGNTQTKKVQEVNAPAPANDVKWLRLEAQTTGSTSAVKQIYRLNTAGGLAPANCEGRAVGDVMTVKYSAQYWMYA